MINLTDYTIPDTFKTFPYGSKVCILVPLKVHLLSKL